MLTPTSTFVVFPVGTSAFLSTLSTSVLELLAFFAASSNECIGEDINELFDDLDPSTIELLGKSELNELLYDKGSEVLETKESLEVRFSGIFELLRA